MKTLLACQQELNTQFQQVIDVFLLALALFAAHALRSSARAGSICRTRSIPSRNYQWLLIVIIPFGPILLDLEGFYESPFNRTLGKSFIRTVRTMIYLSILVSGCVTFLRLPLTSRAVPLLLIVIATVALLIKDRMIATRISFRAGEERCGNECCSREWRRISLRSNSR